MPQGLSLSASLPVALAVSIALGSQHIFCPLSLAVCALGCLMSRGDELRQLAAQLSVLAALEDSILPTGSASPVAPFTRLSCSSRCLSRVAAIRRRLWTLCTLCSGLRGPSRHGVCVQLR